MAPPTRPWLCPRDTTCRATPGGIHDDHNAYLRGCRSGAAGHHHNQALARYRAGDCDTLVDATGAARRLQALAVLGHTGPTIAALMGYDRATISRLTKKSTPRIHSTTAARVHRAWEELSETEPPHLTSGASRVRNAAIRRGWAPVEAWDPDTIDDPTAKPWQLRAAPDGGIVEAALALGLRWDSMTPADQEELVEGIRGVRTSTELADYVHTTPDEIKKTWDRILGRRRRHEALARLAADQDTGDQPELTDEHDEEAA